MPNNPEEDRRKNTKPMTREEIIAANRKSALEQLEQDERNEDLKADMNAEQLMKGAPHRPHYFPENPDTKNEELQSIIKENIKASQ